MAGIFKVLANIIPARDLAVKSHNFRLATCGLKFLPAYYYNPNLIKLAGLQQGHNHDIFELTQVSYALQRQTTSFQNTLNSIEDEQKFASLKANIESAINENQNAQSVFNTEIVKMLKGKVNCSNIPVATAAQIIFVLANSQHQDAKELVQGVIPVILKKINYASTRNIMDITVGLNSLNLLSEKSAVDAVIGQISQMKFPWEMDRVKYHAWEINVYEKNPAKITSVTKNEFDVQYKELQNSEVHWRYGTLKRLAQRELNYGILNRLLWRENRVAHTFEEINQKEEIDAFAEALEGLGEEHAGAKKVILERLGLD